VSVSGLFNPLHFRRVGAVGTYGGGGGGGAGVGGVYLSSPPDATR
jgi:hypothetical protein